MKTAKTNWIGTILSCLCDMAGFVTITYLLGCADFSFSKSPVPFCCLQQTAGSIPCSGKISAATFQEELLSSLPFWLLAVLQRFYTLWDFCRLRPSPCTCLFFDSSCPEGGSCDTIFQKKSSFFGFFPPFLTRRIYGIISRYAGFPDFLVSNFFIIER